MSGWEQQMECERRRFEEEQELLQRDPAYAEWLESIDAMRRSEQERKS